MSAKATYEGMAGIYCIENTVTGKRYVGQSQNIGRRWMQHKAMLRKGAHLNKLLQADWKQFGEDAFTFYVIEFLDRDKVVKEFLSHLDLAGIIRKELLWREQGYIKEFETYNPSAGYNVAGNGKANNAQKRRIIELTHLIDPHASFEDEEFRQELDSMSYEKACTVIWHLTETLAQKPQGTP